MKQFSQYSIIVFLIISFVILAPTYTPNLRSNPQSTTTYEQAMEKITQLSKLDTEEINPVCNTLYLTHGKKVEKAIVFFHGFTNCPKQFERLAEKFYELGYNVFIPRLPHHGFKDRLTDDLKNLTAEELAQITDFSVDIANGLGEKIAVAGLSGGGIMSAWAAQNRSDVETAAVIAPNFTPPYNLLLATPITNLFLYTPNRFVDWDDKGRDLGPQYAYPRFSSKAVGEIMRFGKIVQLQAMQTKPKAGKILVILNDNDEAINNQAVYDYITILQKKGANVQTFSFEKSLNAVHDIIDPNQPNQRIDTIYPKLIELLVR